MSNREVHELKKLVRAKRGRGPFAPEARERLKAFLRDRWEAGDSLKRWGDELGLSAHTVQYWRSHWGRKPESETALRVVEVVAETQIESMTVHGPAGTRVDGLTMDEIAELWRRLS